MKKVSIRFYNNREVRTILKKSQPELTTKCSQLKLTAADGKRYMTDCFVQKDIDYSYYYEQEE